jgi:drug/metabolite transporter (DMT)-like permease
MGLANTSVTSSSILCNTSSVFVYILSFVLLKGTKFDVIKALSVVLTIGGIVTVNLGS